MILRLFRIANTTLPNYRTCPFLHYPANKHYFASLASDPYYVLGVEKNAQFSQIKKAYYKLANQYHPDKNNSREASLKFLTIKEAFEAIKISKGLMKVQNLYSSYNYANESVRKNASQFTTDESQQQYTNTDYRVQREKAQQSQQYQQFNTSFRTIHDINEIKIKVQKGQMKDASERFELANYKAKIQKYSESGVTYIVISVVGGIFIFFLFNKVYAETDQRTKQRALDEMSKLSTRKNILSQENLHKEQELAILANSSEIQQLKKLQVQRKIDRGIRVTKKQQVISSQAAQSA